MSNWVDFCSGCPIANCPDPQRVIYWKHGDNCGSLEDINEEGYIRCKKVGCDLNREPCFILELLFKCKYHPNYEETDPMTVFHALSIVSSGTLGLNKKQCQKLLNKINNYDGYD